MIRVIADAVNARVLDAPPNVHLELYNLMSYMVDGYEHSKAFRARRWDGRASFYSANTGSFPAGFFDVVVAHLRKGGHKIQVSRIPAPPPIGPSIEQCILKTGFAPNPRYAYQGKIAEELVKRRQMIAQAATGCHAPGTRVIMFDGSTKVVEDVVEGDLLMGPDSKSRIVRRLFHNHGDMYKITPIKGESYVVNADHIMSLRMTNMGGKRITIFINGEKKSVSSDEIVNISVRDYLNQSDVFKHCAKWWRVGVEFPEKPLPIPPYILGAWLGDGDSAGAAITSADREVIDEWVSYAALENLNVRQTLNRKIAGVSTVDCWHVAITGARRGLNKNKLLVGLREIGVLENKHIPKEYLTSSREQRLEILAGILDTDGYLHHGHFDIVVKQRDLADGISYLARSLGLAAYQKETKKSIKSLGFVGEYHRVTISGNVDMIPCRVKRRISEPRAQIKSVLKTGLSVEPVGLGEYFGFSLSGDHLYLLGDFSVTHNSGKSAIAAISFWRIGRPTLFLTTRGVLMNQMKETMESLGEHIGVVGESIWEPNFNGMTVGMVQTIAPRLLPFDIKGESEKMRMIQAIDKEGKPKVDRRGRPVMIKSPAYQSAIKAGAAAVAAYERNIKDRLLQLAQEHHTRRDKTIATLQRFELVILEEAHEVGSDSYYKILKTCINAHYRLALTATPFMRSSDEASMRLMAASGPIGYRVSEKLLIDSGILARPIFKIIEDVPRPPDLFDGMTWAEVQNVAIVNHQARNERICLEAQRAVAHGLSVLVLVTRKRHGHLLQAMFSALGINSQFIYGESSREVRSRALNDLASGAVSVLIGSTVLDVGVDVPSLGMVILAGGGKAEEAARQRIGRGLRAKKSGPNVALIVDFADQYNEYTKKHALERLRVIVDTPGFVDGLMLNGQDFDFSMFAQKAA
jgi:superfamily II DNA or RNA helicase